MSIVFNIQVSYCTLDGLFKVVEPLIFIVLAVHWNVTKSTRKLEDAKQQSHRKMMKLLKTDCQLK